MEGRERVAHAGWQRATAESDGYVEYPGPMSSEAAGAALLDRLSRVAREAEDTGTRAFARLQADPKYARETAGPSEDRAAYENGKAAFVADAWRDQEFDHANMRGLGLKGMQAPGLRVRNGVFDEANLQGARLSGCDFANTRFVGAKLAGAHLAGASLVGAVLATADLAGCDLSRADLSKARLEGTSLLKANLDGALLDGALIDGLTYVRSQWDVTDLALWLARGGRIGNRDGLPDDARTFLKGDGVGLTLSFDSRLHRFDTTAFDAFIAEILGPNTDVTIEERSNIDAAGPGLLRINGSDPEDLVAVAEAFYDRAWETALQAAEQAAVVRAMSGGFAMLLDRLNHQRDHLVRIEETVGILGNPDIQEMLEDQGAGHILAKDKKLLQTRLQRVTRGIGAEVQRRTVGKLGGIIQGEVEDGIEGLLGDGDDE